MLPFLLPTFGLIVWLVHMAQTFSTRGAGWARLVSLVGLPVLSIGGLLYRPFFVRMPPEAGEFALGHADETWLSNAFLGLAVWVVSLLAEPIVVIVSRLVLARRDRHSR